MSVDQRDRGEVEIQVENIGGIGEEAVTFVPGVTVLEGRNATNRSSLLQAVMAACGSENVSIKGDADEAHIELTLGGETHMRSLRRNNGTIEFEGDSYLDDPEIADLFAFLLESNEVRQAVERRDDLWELIMRPVDTKEIEAEIDRLVEERRVLETELDEINSLRGQLPELEEKRTRFENRREEKLKELEEKEATLEAANADIDAERKEKVELEKKLDELRDKRSTLDEIRYDVETERESLEALQAEKAELEDEASEIAEIPGSEIESVDSEIERLRDRKQSIQTEISDLQSIVRFNEERLEDTDRKLHAMLDSEGVDTNQSESVTDQLLESERTTCWTCGRDVDPKRIEDTADALKQLTQRKLDDSRKIQAKLDELKEEREALEEATQKRERVSQNLAEIEGQINERERAIERLEEREEELAEQVDSLEADVESLEDETRSEVLGLQKAVSQLEHELGRLESDLERVEDEISSIQDRLDKREEIEAERASLQEAVTDLRTKIDRLTERAVGEFNEHMDDVLDLLEYRNIERIWLERVERDVREGRRKITRSTFNLHIARRTESGTTYEDTVDHLSESEREVMGLIFALAGYLAHDVHETVPFLLLDSLEAIDAKRIAALVEYLSDYSTYLIVALLPEDASSLDGENRISMGV